MSIYRIEISERSPTPAHDLLADLRAAGLAGLVGLVATRLYFVEGALTADEAQQAAAQLFCDPVTETIRLYSTSEPPPADSSSPDSTCVEVLPRPGVMDPVAETALAELLELGCEAASVRTGRRYELTGVCQPSKEIAAAVRQVLANDCIEEVYVGSAGLPITPTPLVRPFELRHVALSNLSDAELQQLSRSAHLFLTLDELRAIQQHYRTLGREPTDLELETLAQTWSEHCVHKTLRSRVRYRGAALPNPGTGPASAAADAGPGPAPFERTYDNLLKDTIMRATRELRAAQRGPECLSVFEDNAGVIVLDDQFGLAFKVETHNHPSAIEPYGGAATGVGGCIRDIIGCGLGARPIASTDVFCVAPGDWPADELPRGILHPRRVLRGVVRGVSDYGNRMGIPTVNGAVYFDPRYLGNPLVYCGCIGLIPRDRIEKAARPGDHIVLIGGRTGRDGIHGATFSSAELTDTHADEFSHAVQIGNAITEKRVLDAVLRARDDAGGCLYHAITDCGAGGLSSAVGEMAAEIGAVVDLEAVPLKYAGLRYDEIWISEAQERMVLAVAPEKLPRFLEVLRAEECEASVIGVFGGDIAPEQPAAAAPGPAQPREGHNRGARLLVRYQGTVVGELDMHFLHEGLPRTTRLAEWPPGDAAAPPAAQPRGAVHTGPPESAAARAARAGAPTGWLPRLRAELARPNVASKEWIIRQYDHEVQGGSVIKPLFGPGVGPSDAAVLRPRLGETRGAALGCGVAPHWSDVDPYWMAWIAIDEALRNVICVGADPDRIALLDNFCWGRTDDPVQLGALVRACQACYDAACAYGTPFISGKDSLNNEFTLDEGDVERLIESLRLRDGRESAAGAPAAAWRGRLPEIEARLRATQRLSIPPTLLISALGIVPDVRRCVSSDLKPMQARPTAPSVRSGAAGDAPAPLGSAEVLLVGGLPPVGFSADQAVRIHRTVAELIRRGDLAACHDVSEGGWLVSLAEMALGGALGFEAPAPDADAFEECVAGYVVQPRAGRSIADHLTRAGVSVRVIARTRDDPQIRIAAEAGDLTQLQTAWRATE